MRSAPAVVSGIQADSISATVGPEVPVDIVNNKNTKEQFIWQRESSGVVEPKYTGHDETREFLHEPRPSRIHQPARDEFTLEVPIGITV